ncbi:O-antigen ligase family protein [Pedobacter sp. MR22-3]|uniref:O-antigen ligase family protein n=1 Tax=Pedobacter sp. MR22-3 TaxID=2994552 RepID=UPI0022451480|nr:O-antigen ligase family protein [Pedobacter sp. MR22-3]MCX2585929.1 O-antigen ligase family protein [Pedobacter sp. MR22-3]
MSFINDYVCGRKERTFLRLYHVNYFQLLIFLIFVSSFYIHSSKNSFWNQQYHPLIFQGIIFSGAFFALIKGISPVYKIDISKIDIIVLAFLCYSILSGVITRSGLAYDSTTFSYLAYLVLFLLIRMHGYLNNINDIVLNVMMIVFGINVFVSLLQIGKFIEIDDPSFLVTGLFANPGPFGCYIAAMIPLLIYVYRDNKNNRRAFAIVLLICAVLLQVASGSRTAILTSIVASGGMLLIPYLNKLKKSKAIVIAVFSFLCLFIILIFLHRFNSMSVDGRILIWKVGYNMFKEAPVFGNGIGFVNSNYNLFQSTYFSNGFGSPLEKALAGTTYSLFNEYFEILIELGVIGLIIFATLIFFITKAKSGTNTQMTEIKTSLLSILICSFFSYPFSLASISSMFYILIALLVNTQVFKSLFHINLKGSKRVALQVVMVGFILLIVTVGIAIREWKFSIDRFDYDEYGSIKKLDENYLILSNNGAFLFNYGAEMCKRGYFKEAIDILENGKKKMNNVFIYNQLGQAYTHVGSYREAEANYICSMNMVPHMLSSKYALFKLYSQTGKYSKRNQIALDISRSAIKIPTAEAILIKKEIEQFLILKPIKK